MRFLVLIIALLVLGYLLEKILDISLGIDKKEKISDTSGKNVDRWGRGIILVLFLCSLPLSIEQEASVRKWHSMLFIISLWGFQSILEWKYLKNSKQYVITLIFLMLFVIFMYNIEHLFRIFGLD